MHSGIVAPFYGQPHWPHLSDQQWPIFHCYMMKRLHKLAMYLQFAEMARDLHHKNKKTLQAKLASERSAFDQKLRERDEHAKTQAADAQRRAADERESFDQKLRERDEGAQVMQQKLTQLAVQNEVLQSTLQRLQHDHQNTRRQLEAAQQTIKRTERRARQAEERAQQTQFELREQKACLSKQVAHLEASREESRVRCQDLARRLEHHLDERLASSGDEHFDSLQEFPHNQQIAARYRLVVTELRLDALEWMEEHSAVDSDQIAAWLQLAIQLCFGWVTQHKLAQYEKTLELAFGVARHESKEAVCSDGVTGTEILLPSATATDTADAAAQHALWQCKYEYQPPPAEASLGPRASSTRLRPWLLTLLRHVHKSHTQPHRLLSEAKWIWDEMCRAVLSARQDSKDSKGTVVLWSPQIALATPALTLTLPMQTLEDDKGATVCKIHLVYPALATYDGALLVKGELFVSTEQKQDPVVRDRLVDAHTL